MWRWSICRGNPYIEASLCRGGLITIFTVCGILSVGQIIICTIPFAIACFPCQVIAIETVN